MKAEEFYGNEETCHRGFAVNKILDTVNLYLLFIIFFVFFFLSFFAFSSSLVVFFSALLMIHTASSDSRLCGYIFTPAASPERLCNDDDSLRHPSLRCFYIPNNVQTDTLTFVTQDTTSIRTSIIKLSQTAVASLNPHLSLRLAWCACVFTFSLATKS